MIQNRVRETIGVVGCEEVRTLGAIGGIYRDASVREEDGRNMS